MVRFWRRRKASAPSLMASEISRIAGVPVSFLRTQEARNPATRREPMENVEDQRQSQIESHSSHSCFCVIRTRAGA